MKRKIIEEHKSAYPNPIFFDKGELLSVGRRDIEYPGWIWVISTSGLEGWVPDVILDIHPDGTALAAENYSAKELNTVVGEIVRVRREYGSWYWVSNSQAEKGWIPVSTTAETGQQIEL